jgi:hypothetical protein
MSLVARSVVHLLIMVNGTKDPVRRVENKERGVRRFEVSSTIWASATARAEHETGIGEAARLLDGGGRVVRWARENVVGRCWRNPNPP